jgi:predicted dehydrogenase
LPAGVSRVVLYDADPRAASLACRELGRGETAASFESLLEREPEVVVVATPAFAQRDLAVGALRAGASVFCEKPLGLSLADGLAIVRAAAAAERRLGAGLDLSATRIAREAADAVFAGWIGRVVRVSVGWSRGWFPGSKRACGAAWLTERRLAGGGVLKDLGVHVVDLALRLCGYPAGPYVFTAEASGKEGARIAAAAGRAWDVEDTVSAQGSIGDGVGISVFASWLAERDGGERIWAEVTGTSGRIRLKSAGGKRLLEGEISCAAGASTALGASERVDTAALALFLEERESGGSPASLERIAATCMAVDLIARAAATGATAEADLNGIVLAVPA